MHFEYTVLDNVNGLDKALKSDVYDVVIADEDLITDNIRQAYTDIAIITTAASKAELEAIISKHRAQ